MGRLHLYIINSTFLSMIGIIFAFISYCKLNFFEYDWYNLGSTTNLNLQNFSRYLMTMFNDLVLEFSSVVCLLIFLN